MTEYLLGQHLSVWIFCCLTAALNSVCILLKLDALKVTFLMEAECHHRAGNSIASLCLEYLLPKNKNKKKENFNKKPERNNLPVIQQCTQTEGPS